MAPSRIAGQIRTHLRCRLCWRVTLAVFAAIFVIEAAILIPSYRNQERNLLDGLDEICQAGVVAASSYILHHGRTELLGALEDLTKRGKLVGGTVYDADGAAVGTFGERPVNSLEKIAAAPAYMRDSNRYEVVWPPAKTGLDITVLGRINASSVPVRLQGYVWRIAGLVLLISGFVAVVTMAFLSRTLLGPMLSIRDNLFSAQRDPAHADRYAISHGRNDELGEVATALNSLLKRVSKTHREDLAAMVAMAENSNEAIIAYDRSWTPVFANDACNRFCNTSGITQLVELSLPRFALADRSGTLSLSELLSDGDYSGEAVLIGADSARLSCYVNAGHILDENGDVLRYYATVTDVTELSDVRCNLERQNLELETSSRAKTEFVANISHELRTPLNAIIGFSDMMKNEAFGPLGAEQYNDYVADINDSGNHLLEIINDILDLSKIEAGRFEIRDQEIDPVGAIEGSIRLIRDRARGRNIDIATEVAERLPRMRGDGQKIKQILINLLTNAVKFTPEGGRVMITAKTEPDGHMAISIKDNGVGIAEEDHEKVMLPFGQADSGLARKFEGTGLGLPLAKAMMELHDGRLDLVSKPDHGTTVTMRFPASRIIG